LFPVVATRVRDCVSWIFMMFTTAILSYVVWNFEKSRANRAQPAGLGAAAPATNAAGGPALSNIGAVGA
jgi:hypothetical protein